MNIDSNDIAYDSVRKMIYVPDHEGERIVGINANPASPNYKQIEKVWGSFGSGTGQFSGPYGIFYDSGDDLIYVADAYNNRIVRFDPSDPTAIPSGSWNTWEVYKNTGDSFNEPRGVYVDHPIPGKAIAYVADSINDRVVRFEAKNNGSIASWVTFGDMPVDPGKFSRPYGIFYDSGSGYIYVTDAFNMRVTRFKLDAVGALVGGSWREYKTSISGKTLSSPYRANYYQGWVYVSEWVSRVTRFNPDDLTQDWQTFGIFGSGPGEFESVYGVAYDQTSESGGPGSGFFYAISDVDKSIKKFKLDGTGNIILSTWEDFDLFGTDGYDITYNLPADAALLPAGFKFANGTTDIDPKGGSVAPVRSVFAKIEYEIVDTNPSDGENFSSTTVEITGGGATTNATVKANVSAKVDHISVFDKGSGYTSTPTVTIDPPSFGIQATAVANLNASNQVDSITVTSGGSGYTEIPNVTITGVGSGATAKVTIVKGSVTSYTITNPGSGYTSNPTVTVKGAGTGATATANIVGGKVVSIANTSSGSNYNFAVDSSERIVLEIPPPTYSISGNVFNDTDKDGSKDGGENNYPAVPSIAINTTAGTTTYASCPGSQCGSYTISKSTCRNVYGKLCITTCRLFYDLAKSPPNLQVTVGSSPPCNVVDPLTGGSCAGDNVINLNFAISNSMPWIQTYGLDLLVDGGFTNRQPSSTTVDTNCGGGSFASGTSGTSNSPGIVFSGNTNADFGQGSASSTGWTVGGSYSEEFNNATSLKTSTEQLLIDAAKAGIIPEERSGCSGNCTLPSQPGFYHYTGDLVSDKTEIFNGGNHIFVVDGKITFTGDRRIRAQNSATVIFSASNDIIIESSRGAALTCNPLPEGQLQGIFSADHDIIVGGNNGDCTAGPDKMLNIEGMLIANAKPLLNGKFKRERDLCGGNPKWPAITITARPDFLLHIPGFLTKQNNISYEEKP